jgi:hypothetical protein
MPAPHARRGRTGLRPAADPDGFRRPWPRPLSRSRCGRTLYDPRQAQAGCVLGGAVRPADPGSVAALGSGGALGRWRRSRGTLYHAYDGARTDEGAGRPRGRRRHPASAFCRAPVAGGGQALLGKRRFRPDCPRSPGQARDREPDSDPQGFLVLPLAPVLEWIASLSDRCRVRCLEYLDAQIVLCETAAQACARRKQPSFETSLLRMRDLLRANHVLRTVLLSPRLPGVAVPGVAVVDVEAWLHHEPPEASIPLGGGLPI